MLRRKEENIQRERLQGVECEGLGFEYVEGEVDREERRGEESEKRVRICVRIIFVVEPWPSFQRWLQKIYKNARMSERNQSNLFRSGRVSAEEKSVPKTDTTDRNGLDQ